MLLARLANADRDASGPLRGIEERELREDNFVSAKRFHSHLGGPALRYILDQDKEIAANLAVKDLAKCIRETESVVH